MLSPSDLEDIRDTHKLKPQRTLTLSESKVNKIFRRKESEGLPIAPVLQRVATHNSSNSSLNSPKRLQSTGKRVMGGGDEEVKKEEEEQSSLQTDGSPRGGN